MRIRKRIGAWTLVLCLLLGMIPTYAGAEEVAPGTCGDNATWTLGDDGTLTISGTGAMTDYDSADAAPWHDYRASITKAVVQSGITNLGNHALNGCANLTEVTLPASGFTTIGASALRDCSALSAVTIPDSVTSIGGNAFRGCSGLQDVRIPSGVALISDYTFWNCSGLKVVRIPASVTSVGQYAFNGSGLTDVYYQGTETQWNAVDVNDSGNAPLTSAIMHYEDENGDWTSSGTAVTLTSVSITNSRATAYDASGAAITSGIVWSVTPVDNGVTISNEGRLTVATTSTAREYMVTATPDTSGTIAGSAKSANFNVTRSYTITFAAGDGASGSMSAVTTDAVSYALPANGFTAPSGMKFKAWSVNNAEYAPGTEISLDTDITLRNVSDGVELSGEMTVTAVWEQDTAAVTLDHVELNPASVTLDGTNGASVTASAIGSDNNAFTSGVTWSVTPSGNGVEITDEISGAIGIAATATPGEYTVTATYDEVSKSATLTVAASDILASGECGANGDNLTWVLTRDGVLTISGSGAMADYSLGSEGAPPVWYGKGYNDNITSLVLPNGITTIGNSAFMYCGNLTSVTIPSGVTTIGSYAFYDCEKLSSVTIPNSVTRMGQGAFGVCSALTGVTLPPNMTTLTAETFVNSGLTSLTIPDGVTSIGFGALDRCSALASVTIPDSVATIGERAFDQCSALGDVYYGGSKLQWNAVSINSDRNAPLTSATIHYGKYDVTFDANNGEGTMDPVAVSGNSYTLPENGFTAPSGMSFKAWSVNNTEYAPGAAVTLSGDTTVTAVWETAAVTLTSVALNPSANGGTVATAYDASGNAITSGIVWSVTPPDSSVADNAVTIDNVGAITASATAPAGSYTITATPDSTGLVVGQPQSAVFNVTRTYAVEFDANTGGGEMSAQSYTVTSGQTGAYTLPENGFTAPSGMRFKAWSVNNEEHNPGETLNLSGNVTVTALWEEEPVTVTLDHVALSASSVTLDGSKEETVTARAYDASDSIISSGVTWSVTPANQGVTIDETSGAITIASSATAGDYTVTATYESVSQTATLTVAQAVTLDHVNLTRASVTLNGIDVGGSTATAIDTKGDVITSGVSWYLDSEDKNLSYWISPSDGSFILTVGSATPAGDYTITATYNNVSKSATLEVLRGVYTVTFDSNGGSEVEAQTIEGGAIITNIPTPTREGYSFNGWLLNGEEYDFNRVIYTDITLTASWTAISATYEISFAANGGSGSMSPVPFTVATGQTYRYTLPQNGFTAPDGMRFKAWSVNNTEYAAGATVTLSGNTTVTAIWESDSETYTITFAANGGTGTMNPEMFAVTPGQTYRYTLPQNGFTAPDGMRFKAWRVNNAEYAAGATVTLSGDTTVTAVWESDSETHTITFAANGGAGTMNPETFAVTPGQSHSYTLPQNGFTAPNGMRFRAWRVNNTEYAPGATVTLSGDTTVTAQWETAETPDDIIASGYCGGEGDGTNLSWVLTRGGTLTISGSGKMADYEFNRDEQRTNAPWWDNRNSITAVVLESGATTIGNYAFYSCLNMTSVSIPNSVTSIGSSAFMSCRGLTSVSIPDSVTSIGEGAFTSCSGLTSVNVDSGNANYSSENGILFNKNKSVILCYPAGKSELTYAIPGSVTSIGSYAFEGCSILTSVSIPNSVTSIGDVAFYGCSGLTSVSIPNSVTSISAYAFEFCSGLTSVSIPNSVTSIGVGAFAYCSGLTSVSIPNSVTSIGSAAFYDCSRLTDVYYGGTRSQWNTLQSNIGNGNAPLLNATIHFAGTEYTITFAANGGAGTMNPVTVTDNAYTLPQNGFTPPDGMRFRKWSVNNTEYDPGDTISLSADVTVTALWETIPVSSYTVTFDPNGGSAVSPQTLTDGATITNVPTPVRTGYAFKGWTRNGQPYDFATPVTSDITLTAQWEPLNAYTVTFDANGGAGTMSPVTVSGYSYTLPQCAFTPPSRMIFGAWSVNGTELPPGETISLSENVTVTAVWVDPYRTLDRLQDMDGYIDQTWRLAGPLSEFQSLNIDDTILTREGGSGQQSDYAASEGSTKLEIPAGTFARFGEGTHSIAADFQTMPDSSDPGDDGRRVTADYYTVKPSGRVLINADEINGGNGVEAAKAVRDVSYTGRFHTIPRLNDDYFRLSVIDGAIPNGLYFHDGGYFTGTPLTAGTYAFTVGLQIRRNVTDEWPATYADTAQVTITVEQDTAQNVETASDEGYELVERIPATVEVDTVGEWVHLTSKGPFDEFTDFYIDGVRKIRGVDYTVAPCLIDPVTGEVIHPLDGGAITGTFIQLQKTQLSLGTHSLNLEFVKTDPIGNKQVRNASQKVTVTPKATPVVTPVISSGSSSSGGGSSSGGSSGPAYYSVKASKPSHGTISLSATSVTYNKTVTVTVTPDNGYRIKSVSAVDSKSNTVTLNRNGNKYTFSMPKRAVTVSATFERSVYDVSASTAQHGKVTLNSSSASPGATVNGSTTPDKGYLLSGVTVRDADGKNVKVDAFNDGKFTFLMPTGKATVSATFTVKRLASFVDIQGPDWFFDDAEWAYNKSILRGTTEQYWEPQSLMSSVTSIVTLERLDGVDLTPYDTGADDGIDNSQWYASAQRWARDNDILLKDRPFGEREAMTRGECAVMLTNFLRYRGLNVTPTSEAFFTDIGEMTAEELDAFRFLQDANVFRGYADGSIRPKAYLSRAHLSALLHRLSEYIIKTETDGII